MLLAAGCAKNVGLPPGGPGLSSATVARDTAEKRFDRGSGDVPASERPGLAAVRKGEPVELVLGLQDCLTLSKTHNRDLLITLLNIQLADTGIMSAGAYDDLMFNSKLDVQRTETAIETRLGTGDTRTREVTTTQKFNFGLSRKFATGTTASLSHGINRTTTDNPFNTFEFSSSVSLSVKQNLLEGFGATSDVYATRMAEIEAWAVRGDSQVARATVIYSVGQAYWALATAQEKLTVLRAQREASLADLERLKQRRAAGAERELDVLRAESGVASLDESIIAAESDLSKASDELIETIDPELLSGYALAKGFKLTMRARDGFPADRTFVADPDLQSLVIAGLTNRMDLQAAIERARAAGIKVSQRDNAALPKLDADLSGALWGYGGAYDRALDEIESAKNKRYGITLTFEMPLQNTADRAARQTAAIDAERALVKAAQAETKVIREVIDAARSLVTARNSLAAAQRSAALASREYQAAMDARNSGSGSQYEVRQSQAQLTMKQLDSVKARAAIEVAELALRKATGELGREQAK
jgi:outer membrane protein TolC